METTMEATDTRHDMAYAGMTATYSPEDNKLRLYSLHKLDTQTYERARALGFSWAPKQGLFVAPAWTPSREDFLLEICGEIEDEDRSLTERAEDRAARFEDYSESRNKDADRAAGTVRSIGERIPFGQPILVGHHSERGHRRAIARMDAGMHAAVTNWKRAEYWTDRAARAVAAAKYKERPDVRARRIKKLETEARGMERRKAGPVGRLAKWTEGGEWTAERVFALAGPKLTEMLRGGTLTPEEARAWGENNTREYIAHVDRWLDHLGNRLAYERAMLTEAGGIASDRVQPEKGGACKCWAAPRGGWAYIVKVNKATVTIFDNWGNGGENFTRTIPFDKLSALKTAAEVRELAEAGRLAEDATRTGFYVVEADPARAVSTPPPPAPLKVEAKPLLNYSGPVCFWTTASGGQYVTREALHMTKAEHAQQSIRRTHGAKAHPDDKTDSHRVRVVFTKDAQTGRHEYFPVFLTDCKAHPRP